jgi:hypothetical protein
MRMAAGRRRWRPGAGGRGPAASTEGRRSGAQGGGGGGGGFTDSGWLRRRRGGRSAAAGSDGVAAAAYAALHARPAADGGRTAPAVGRFGGLRVVLRRRLCAGRSALIRADGIGGP